VATPDSSAQISQAADVARTLVSAASRLVSTLFALATHCRRWASTSASARYVSVHHVIPPEHL
jgi:hypothetical protein